LKLALVCDAEPYAKALRGNRLDIRLLVVLAPLLGIESCPLVEGVDWVGNFAITRQSPDHLRC